MSSVILNGKLVGSVDDGKATAQKIREARRAGEIPYETSVRYREDMDTVVINSDGGRLLRALIVVKDGKPLITSEDIQLLSEGRISWEDLVKQGKIDYLDAEEEEDAYIALNENELTKEHTHLEISPLSVLGMQAALLPFVNHNNGHRNIPAVKSVLQGVGIYNTNYLMRVDNDSAIAIDQQRPIVKTVLHDRKSAKSHPFGQNVVVAVMSYLGYNMDDAIIVNKSSVERGLFRSMFFRPYKTAELHYIGGQTDEITIPDKDVIGYKSEDSYSHLDEDGIVSPTTYVSGGDVVIGKVSPPRFVSALDKFRLGIQKRVESSVECRPGEEGVVDTVYLYSGDDGTKHVTVKVRQDRPVEIGDKFGTRSGQKGVVGMLFKQEDMPFTLSGIVPDIIFSPYSIPSRMTMGYLLELIGGKVGSLGGRFVDGTPFTGESEEALREELASYGFRDTGVETMYNGITGEEIKARIFVGDMMYIRLKHFVSNKIQWRARGPVQLLTRQPTEGRSKRGGLRLGEMEKDGFIAHGAALALKERFDSDKVVIPVCAKCGSIAVYNFKRRTGYCPIDGE
ncbi:MAG: DNA-directed RNA polymerase subunit B, partial [Nanoarchaeota archaeon]|nr:DNA-directed RNA polymerase subunit B [Nanoarchaeota archaeon]